MSDNAENAATRLWRDRAQLREQERNEAQARARIAEEKVAILMAENDRLSAEVERLRDLLTPDAVRERVETQQQMQALKVELLSLLINRLTAPAIDHRPRNFRNAPRTQSSSACRFRVLADNPFNRAHDEGGHGW